MGLIAFFLLIIGFLIYAVGKTVEKIEHHLETIENSHISEEQLLGEIITQLNKLVAEIELNNISRD